MTLDIVKAALFVALVVTAQISIVDAFPLVDGHADIVLLALAGIALLRGPVFGAAVGFFAGLLLDVASLGTLGLSSLLFTLGGYWVGRFGEATSNRRNQVPRVVIAVAALVVGVTAGSVIVHLLLGEPVAVDDVIVRALLPSLALDLVLALPAYAVCRRLFPPRERKREVALA